MLMRNTGKSASIGYAECSPSLSGMHAPGHYSLLATGSEVHTALDAARLLAAEGVPTRVVSMVCWELFRAQDQSYRDEVLPSEIHARVAVEAASPFGWSEWIGASGATVTLDRFGASAPYQRLFDAFGFTGQHVAQVARGLL